VSPGAATAAGVGEEVRLLFFRSGGERFAVDVACVREILPVQPATPVPFVPEAVAGIINHRGTIYTLVRFSRLAHLPEDRAAGIVLLRLPEMAIGICVEQVDGIERLPAALLAAGAALEELPDAPFLRRFIDREGRLIHAVDAGKFTDTLHRLPGLGQAPESEPDPS
jgi:purine-binding chemotaxis protein CheW